MLGGGGLFDRGPELESLAEVLERAGDGKGTVTLVEGQPGMGKTRLLHEARSLARRAGARPLLARCSQLERDFAYGVVRQLFEPAMASTPEGERASVLGGAASAAATLLGDRPLTANGPQAWPADTVITKLNALYWLTSNLAERGPLLLLVDDAHWSDTASLRFLDFLARRIDELPVALVLAVRWSDAGDTAVLLTTIANESQGPRLRLRPLGDDAMVAIVGAVGAAPPEATFIAACRTVTGGNPFLVGELVADLRDRGIPAVAGHVDDVLQLGPSGIARALELRLAGMEAEASALSNAVAILGDGVSPALAGAFCGLSPEEVGRAGDALARCGLFADGEPLAFRHPIQRTAVYADLSRSVRAEGHRVAAEVLLGQGAEPEQVAAHLLRCDPRGSPEFVQVLRRAAGIALALGSPEVAATYLQRAIAEPCEPSVRSDVLIELCVAEARSADPSSFESLRLGLGLVEDPHQRAEVAVEVARAIGMIADMAGALELLDRAICDLGDGDEALALRLQAEYISVARLYPGTHTAAMERLRRLRPAAASPGVTGPILLANLAMERIEECDLPGAVDLATQAIAGGELQAEELWMFAYAANALTWADQTEAAERAWTEVFRRAQHRGSINMLHLAAIWRSHLALRGASVGDAEADARLGLSLCRERAWRHSRPYAVAFLVDALLERQALVEAALVLEENPSTSELHYLSASVGRLRCCQGRFAEGLELFLRCGSALADQGADRNPSVIPWRSSAALAALQLGDRDRARELADDEVTLAIAFGAPRAQGMALRARALVEQGAAQIDHLEEAVCVLGRSPARLEHARALTDLGAALRRAGRRAEAAVQLHEALDRAHRCGGVAVRDRAREELLRSGLRPRRFAATGIDALTPSERRVADQAAAGLGNREIAQSLFVSLKTVEAHLSSVYRKLGVSARWQLAEAWATAQPPPLEG